MNPINAIDFWTSCRICSRYSSIRLNFFFFNFTKNVYFKILKPCKFYDRVALAFLYFILYIILHIVGQPIDDKYVILHTPKTSRNRTRTCHSVHRRRWTTELTTPISTTDTCPVADTSLWKPHQINILFVRTEVTYKCYSRRRRKRRLMFAAG